MTVTTHTVRVHEIEDGDILTRHLGQRVRLPLLCDGQIWSLYNHRGRLICMLPCSVDVEVIRGMPTTDDCDPQGIERPLRIVR